MSTGSMHRLITGMSRRQSVLALQRLHHCCALFPGMALHDQAVISPLGVLHPIRGNYGHCHDQTGFQGKCMVVVPLI